MYSHPKAVSVMSIIHEEKGIGVVTETEVILKNGQKFSLNEIGYAKYESHFAVWFFATSIVGAGTIMFWDKDSQITGIFFIIIWCLHFFKASVGRLVIYNKRGGQIASQGITLWCEEKKFVEAINKYTK